MAYCVSKTKKIEQNTFLSKFLKHFQIHVPEMNRNMVYQIKIPITFLQHQNFRGEDLGKDSFVLNRFCTLMVDRFDTLNEIRASDVHKNSN